MKTVTSPFATSNEQVYQEPESKIVGLYARVSTGRQGMYGYSLDEQIKLGRERCAQLGWPIRYIFREEGESAGTTDRPKFKIMLEKAQQGSFNVLMFWKLDRFCRSLLDVVNVEKQLQEYGVSLYSLTEQIDTTSSFGRFNFRNIASAAEWELDMHKERCQMGMKALAEQEKWPNRIIPYGYKKLRNDRLRIHTDEAKIVRRIFRLYVNRRSMPDIAFLLNQEGVNTKRDNLWTKVSIKRILDNELYVGHYQVAGVSRTVKEYRIVGNRLFEEAKNLRNRYRHQTCSMPKNRKQEIVERIFREYLESIQVGDDT